MLVRFLNRYGLRLLVVLRRFVFSFVFSSGKCDRCIVVVQHSDIDINLSCDTCWPISGIPFVLCICVRTLVTCTMGSGDGISGM